MNSKLKSVLVVISLLVTGCGTSSIAEKLEKNDFSYPTAEYSEFDVPCQAGFEVKPSKHHMPAGKSVVNLEPDWYWDDAWDPDNESEQKLSQAEQKALVQWCFCFLLRKKQNGNETTFVGIQDENGRDGYRDPSDGVMNDLIKAGHKVKPCSKARFPKDKEKSPKDSNTFRGLEDPSTGREARLLYIRIDEVLPNGMILAELGSYSGPLAGSGQRVILQKRKGKWKVLWILKNWIS